MFAIRASNIVQALADQMLSQEDRAGINPDPNDYSIRQHKGIAVYLSLGLAHYTAGKSFERHVDVVFVICGNRHVWISKNDNRTLIGRAKDVPLNNWVNTSNHDSCWRSDGIDSPISRIYFDFAESINSELKKKVAPLVMSDQSSFGLCSKFFEIITVTHASDRSGLNHWWRKIIKID